MSLESHLPEGKPDRKQVGVRLLVEDNDKLMDLAEELQTSVNATITALIRKAHEETFDA